MQIISESRKFDGSQMHDLSMARVRFACAA